MATVELTNENLVDTINNNDFVIVSTRFSFVSSTVAMEIS